MLHKIFSAKASAILIVVCVVGQGITAIFLMDKRSYLSYRVASLLIIMYNLHIYTVKLCTPVCARTFVCVRVSVCDCASVDVCVGVYVKQGQNIPYYTRTREV